MGFLVRVFVKMTEYVAKGNNEIHVLLLICSQRVLASSVRDDWASFIQTDQIFFQRGFFSLVWGGDSKT